jgi:hypothetical protein
MAIAISTVLFTGCAQPQTNSLISAEIALSPAATESTASATMIAQTTEISDDRLGFDGVHLGMAESELAVFGDPVTDQVTPNPNYEVVRLLDYFNGLSATVADGTIVGLLTQTTNVATIDGMRVGDDRRQIIATYGEPDEVGSDEDGERIAYYNDDSGSYLVFGVADDRIITISCGWLLD